MLRALEIPLSSPFFKGRSYKQTEQILKFPSLEKHALSAVEGRGQGRFVFESNHTSKRRPLFVPIRILLVCVTGANHRRLVKRFSHEL